MFIKFNKYVQGCQSTPTTRPSISTWFRGTQAKDCLMGDCGFSLSKPDKPKSSGRSPIWKLVEFDSFEIASATPKLCRSLLELCRVPSLVDRALLKRV